MTKRKSKTTEKYLDTNRLIQIILVIVIVVLFVTVIAITLTNPFSIQPQPIKPIEPHMHP